MGVTRVSETKVDVDRRVGPLSTAVCPVCRTEHPLTKNGVFRSHVRSISSWQKAPCQGSGQRPRLSDLLAVGLD